MSRDFGHRVLPVGPRQQAEQVARAIATCIRSPQAEVYPFGPSRWLAVLGVVAPRGTDRLVRQFARRRKGS